MKNDKRDYIVSDNRGKPCGSRNSKREKNMVDNGYKHDKLLTRKFGHDRDSCKHFGHILRKWLNAQVGRNWDKVYSDFKAICKTNNLYQVDVNWWVELDAKVVDGELINSKGQKVYYWKLPCLYVDKNNVLKVFCRRQEEYDKNPITFFWIDKETRYGAEKIDGIWYMAGYHWVPGMYYGGKWEMLCWTKKQMNKKEKRKYGVK